MRTTIDPGNDVVTLINVFTVDPTHRQELLELLEDATEHVMRSLPGFVSANLHRGLDGRSVANCAQWRSVADFEAAKRDPTAMEHMQRAAALAEEFRPTLYQVSFVDRADSAR